MSSIDDFKSKLVGGGARSNLFRVILNWPGFAQGDAELASFMIKNAQIPEGVVGAVVTNFRGRQAKFAGDRQFNPINFTVINDTNFAIRNAFERWQNEIGQNQSNIGQGDHAAYKADFLIQQLDRKHAVIKEYKIIGAFPTNIGAIDLSFDNENQIEEFSVEMELDYWTSNTTT